MKTKIIDGKECKLRDVVYSNSLEDQLYGEDVVYSWEDSIDESEEKVFSFEDGAVDSTYSALNSRLVMLKRPLHMQLQELYREHSRMYRTRGKSMKPEEIDLLMDDFRYELHRIIAKAKDQVTENGGNLDMILRLSTFKGGAELSRASKSLTMLFKRIEKAFTTYGYIPREFQSKLNDGLGVLLSHFVMDVYGAELEKRKAEKSI